MHLVIREERDGVWVQLMGDSSAEWIALDEAANDDLQLTRYGQEGWRATFFPAGRARSVVARTAWEATARAAVQAAALAVLVRRDALA